VAVTVTITGRAAVWTPVDIEGCVLALEAADVAPGPVVVWPDRSPAGNDLMVDTGAPTAAAGFVTCTTADVLRTTADLPMSGAAPRHMLYRVRTRAVLRVGASPPATRFMRMRFPEPQIWRSASVFSLQVRTKSTT